MAASKAEAKAQKSRSARYGISVREDGNVTKPQKWESLRDSQFGDPVNYLFPVPDKAHAANAKSRFAQFGEKYDGKSRRSVRGRLNRLLRKFSVDPIEEQDEEREEFSGALIGKIELSGEEGDEPGTVIIPAVRMATYKHPWFGELYFDDDLFDSFIDNYETGVVGTDLSINAEHRRGPTGDMALAWVNEMFVDDNGTLNLKGRATKTGEQYLGEEYRYASIEFTNDFVDQETGVNYGPTLVGCAATNIPFVHRNTPIQTPALDTSGNLVGYMTTTETSDNVSISTPNPEGVLYFVMPEAIEEELEDKELTMPDEKDVKPDNTEETPPVVDAGSPKQEEPPKVQAVAALELPDGEVITAEQVAQLLEDNRTNKLTIKQNRIDGIIQAAQDRGVAPVVLQLARQILDACEPSAQAMIKLTQKEGEEQEVNLFEAIEQLVGQVPGRIGELTYARNGDKPPEEAQNKNPYTDNGKLTLEEAEQQAREYRQNSSHYPALVEPEL
jgi:hypothetical protein